MSSISNSRERYHSTPWGFNFSNHLPPVLVWLGRERVLQSKKKDQQYTTVTQEVQY
jgi:hypothetical protein